MQEAKRRKPQSGLPEEDNLNTDDENSTNSRKNSGGLFWVLHVMLTCLLIILYARERDARITVEGMNERLTNEGSTLIDQLHTVKAQLEQKPACPDCPICPVCKSPKCPACAKCPPIPKKSVKGDSMLEHKLQLWKDRHKTLTEALQKTSKEILALKYGPEPYIVELHLDLPEGQADGVITVQMAPAALVPHAVLYFLSQVSSGAWNGCSFIRNAHHVLQADPRGQNCDRKKFRSLESVEYSIPFQEYHADFPHKALTLGLAGRPGGPDFYISTVDNTGNHGPGGQGSYEVSEEADSCFGKVVAGEDVVARMRKLPVLPGSFNELKTLVTITEARLVTTPSTSSSSDRTATTAVAVAV